MSKIDVNGLAGPLLVAGEEAIAGVRVNWNGMVRVDRLEASQGLTGLGVAEAEAPPLDPDALVVFPSAKQMALVLTGGRLLCWSLGFSGKPKQFLGDVPLSAVDEVTLGDLRLGSVLRFALKSGTTVDLEVLRGDDAQGFFDLLRGLVEPQG